MKLVAQIIGLINLTITFLAYLYTDINGKPARPPTGFSGVVATLMATAFGLAIAYYSGALSEILP